MTKLFMDTTLSTLQLALESDGEIMIRFQQSTDQYRYHSAILIPQIQALLEQMGQSPGDLTGVCVNLGPGSFTGIRTGLTVARVMGQFLAVPCYGFNTFELMAACPAFLGQSVTILLNAFRGQHYRATLQVDTAGNITWFSESAVYHNTDSITVETAVCLMDSSLQDKLQVTHPNPQILAENTVFAPDAMTFLLSRRENDYRFSWQDLKPLYLQLPNITTAKLP